MKDFNERYIAARRAVIAQDLKRLNPMQRNAAMTTEGPLLLLAGAGSGKTTVLIQRVYNLLTYGRGSDTEEVPEWAGEEELAFLEGFPENPTEADWQKARRLCAVDVPKPWQIIAITFTNKAAGELKDRLAARLGPLANDIWASTFHSACVRILRRDIDRLGFERSFTIYDTDDAKRVIRDIVKEMNLDDKTFAPKSVLSAISRAKDQYIGPEEFAKKYTAEADWRMARIAKIYKRYQERLAASSALDFDDIIFHAVSLFQKEPEVLEFYQDKFRYVLVDEYQDTNQIQYLFTSLLAGKRRNLCVVGDDDQSIYKFRGANIENILNFEAQYQDARVIRLEQNYRSTQNILDAANAVIQNNAGRKGKTLWTDNGSGDAVSIRTNYNETDEAAFVAGDILARVGRGAQFKDAAVLYRMNTQSNALEYAMKRSGVPYKIVGGIKFFDRAEIRDMLAYLCVLNNPLDDLRLRRIVNTPARGIGNTSMDRVAMLAQAQESSLYEIIRNADLFPELKASAPKLLKFADLIDGLRKAGGTLALPEFYDAVCEQTGYVKALRDKNDNESRGRLENVQELKSNIMSFLEQDPEDPTLSGFLNEIALYTDLDSLEMSEDAVTLMTIHSAKGLEFPLVYVVGMEEGIFPGTSAMYEPEDMEEERRLCYVAMTRAKKRLTMTTARQRMLYGRTSSNLPSRFLEELPAEPIEWLSRQEPKGVDRWGEEAVTLGGGSNSGAGGGGQTPVSRYGPAARTARPARPLRDTGFTASAGGVKSSPLPSIQKGDSVEHRTFGRGMVLAVTPMGNDAMVEIAFDGVGTKKLMLRAAGARIKKL